MGSYGIGIERIVAAAIEQGHDERGIVWDPCLTPYHVHLIPVKMDKPEVREAAEGFYRTLTQAGFECLIDDRSVSPGFKFKDADLIGVPLQLVVGDHWIQRRHIECKRRKNGSSETIPEASLLDWIATFYSESSGGN
jgi:prolyl-tRNA synthetase